MVLKEEEARLQDSFESVPLRMHPRVFAALGENLVTDDIVAVIELVKNSYDAFAHNVWLIFSEDPVEGKQFEIRDDGIGMTRETIEGVWCLVATPHKSSSPTIGRENRVRRVVGEKGLGRLSAARLGRHLRMITQAAMSPCWEVTVDWSAISKGEDLSNSYVRIREYSGGSRFNGSGTRISISGLSGQWDAGRLDDLKENLSRLISPFSELDDFKIFLCGFDGGDADAEEIEISSPEFLSRPKYRIKGTADAHGNVERIYQFADFALGEVLRERKVSINWESIFERLKEDRRYHHSSERACCGPISFEIRAWDLRPEDTLEISETFHYQKNLIRKAIGSHKGISLYRDGLLVLPKSENTRDWLGLDLKRVSRVGDRLSTNQLVGYVSISADDNPRIEDTSDRERLVSCLEVSEFEAIIRAAVGLLQIERSRDRIPERQEEPMTDLFSKLNADPLIERVDSLAEEGAKASEVIPLMHKFNDVLDSTRRTIEKRFVYYSRLATIGTIAQMLVHEIRNRTTVIGSAFGIFKKIPVLFLEKDEEEIIFDAQAAVDSLEGLADRFAPLASRNFRRGKRSSVLEDRIGVCLSMQERDIRSKGIETKTPPSHTRVAVDPGELDAIILNLVTNATYWLGEVPRGRRHLEFKIETISGGNRVKLWVNDSGPGIYDEDKEKVFWPGVTRKPDGIGMGLTVASELVAAYGGRMSLSHHGTLGGASFAFDLPVLKD